MRNIENITVNKSWYLKCSSLPAFKSFKNRSSCCGSAEMNLTSTMMMQVWSLASLSGLRIRCCCELWCRSQIQLGAGIAMAMVLASGCSSDLTHSLVTSTCCRCSPKKTKKKKKKCFKNINHVPNVNYIAVGGPTKNQEYQQTLREVYYRDAMVKLLSIFNQYI